MRSPVHVLAASLSLFMLSLIPLAAQTAKFATSTSTNTTLAPSPGTITLGDTVTFTATVTAATGTPTGLVTFFDGATPLGSGTLTIVAGQSQSSFSTSILSAAGSPHSIAATYQGDATHSSSTSSPISETVNLRSSATGVVLLPTNVVIGQGSGATATVTDTDSSFPPGTADTFSPTGAPITGRIAFTSTLFADGLVLVAGGIDANGNFLNTAEIYSVAAGNFSATGNLTQARASSMAVLLPTGKILIEGGTSGVNVLNSAELFDPSAGTFRATSGVMTAARVGATATLLNTGKVLIAGGQNSGGVLSSAELYDPITDTFSPTGSMNTARTGQSATLLGTGKVLIAGGSNTGNGFGARSTGEVFDPAANGGTGAFTTIAPSGLSEARWQPEAALLLSGKVLIAGGVANNGTSFEADLYDPVTNEFTPSNHSMSQARAGGSAIVLPNGMVLLAGGTTSQAVDLYDPDSDRFDPTGSLQASDGSLVYSPLNNGQVLATGLTTGFTPQSDAKLYSPSFNPLGTVTFTSSEATDNFTAGGVLVPSTSTTSTGSTSVTPFNVATNPHTISGTYPADAVHSPSSNTASLTVVKDNTTPTITAHTPNPSVVGQSVSISVSVTPNAPGGGTPTGTVSVGDGAGETCTITLSSGTGSCSLTPVTAGTDTLTAGYNGDPNYNSSGAAGVTQTVSPGSTNTQVVSSLNPSMLGQSVTFTATVTAVSPAIGTPTGSVTFNIPGFSPATAPLQNNGGPNLTALFTTSAIPAGDTSVSAAYSGNSNFASSIGSVSGGQVVIAPPSISAAFDSPTIEVNRNSSLTITITNPSANTVSATGIAFSGILPSGLAVVSTPTNSCGGTLNLNGLNLGLSGGTLGVNNFCTISMSVTSSQIVTYTYTTGAVSSTNGGTGNNSTATLSIVTGSLGGSFGAKTGAMNARVWTINIGNGTSGTAIGAEVDSLMLTQTFGATCTPSITSSFPAAAGSIPSHGTGSANVTIDFSSCSGRVFFKAVANLSADGHTVTGIITALNQLP